MATFGNTSAATNTSNAPGDSNFENGINGAKFTLSEAGVPTSMSASVLCNTDNKRMRMMVYRDSDKRLMGETEEITVTANAARQVVTANFLRDFNLPAADYWLMITSESVGLGGAWLGNSASTGGSYQKHDGGWSYVIGGERAPVTLSPVLLTGFNMSDDQVCIYCTYTPGSMKILGDPLRESTYVATIENQMQSGVFTMPSGNNGLLDKFWAWMETTGGGVGNSLTIKVAIYRNDTGALVAQSNELSLLDTEYNAWKQFTFGSPPTLEATIKYYLVEWCNSQAATTVNTRVGGSGGEDEWYRVLTYGAWPDPHGMAQNVPAGIMSVYLTYTEVAAGQPIDKRKGGIGFSRGDSGLFVPRRF